MLAEARLGASQYSLRLLRAVGPHQQYPLERLAATSLGLGAGAPRPPVHCFQRVLVLLAIGRHEADHMGPLAGPFLQPRIPSCDVREVRGRAGRSATCATAPAGSSCPSRSPSRAPRPAASRDRTGCSARRTLTATLKLISDAAIPCTSVSGISRWTSGGTGHSPSRFPSDDVPDGNKFRVSHEIRGAYSLAASNSPRAEVPAAAITGGEAPSLALPERTPVILLRPGISSARSLGDAADRHSQR